MLLIRQACGAGETLLRYKRTIFLPPESEPRQRRALFPMRRVSKSVFIMPSSLYLGHKPENSRVVTAVLTNTMEALGKKGWACRNKNFFLELPLVTLSCNGFMAGGWREGNQEALSVLVPLRGSHSVNPSLPGLNLACNYPAVLGVLSLPPSSQGFSVLLGEWLGSWVPTINPGPGPTGRKKLCWGWKRKACLGLECGPGYHLSPPLPGPEA